MKKHISFLILFSLAGHSLTDADRQSTPPDEISVRERLTEVFACEGYTEKRPHEPIEMKPKGYAQYLQERCFPLEFTLLEPIINCLRQPICNPQNPYLSRGNLRAIQLSCGLNCEIRSQLSQKCLYHTPYGIAYGADEQLCQSYSLTGTSMFEKLKEMFICSAYMERRPPEQIEMNWEKYTQRIQKMCTPQEFILLEPFINCLWQPTCDSKGLMALEHRDGYFRLKCGLDSDEIRSQFSLNCSYYVLAGIGYFAYEDTGARPCMPQNG